MRTLGSSPWLSRLGIAALIIAVVFALALPATAAAETTETHCVALVGEGGSFVEGPCFGSPEESFAAATNREVLEPYWDQLESQNGTSTETAVSAQPSVLSVEYDGSSYTGDTWTFTGGTGCGAGTTWYVDSMPAGWNDRVYSAIGYSGCRIARHYEHVERVGASRNCTCSSMGVMNNETSSIQWNA